MSRVLSFIDCAALAPMRLVVNAGNGAAGPTFDAIAEALAARGARLDIRRLNHRPDGSFPNGVPNPLLPANHADTGDAVRAAGADLGVAWDGDFDRCFFFDETGTAVPGEYVVGLLARSMLERDAESRIVHDPRAVWNTRRIIAAHGGQAIASPVGYVFMKERMRRDHPSSGELNFRVADPARIMADIRARYCDRALAVDELDGLSLEFADWRFNLRTSNTEPLLRLSVETAGSQTLLRAREGELSDLIRQAG